MTETYTASTVHDAAGTWADQMADYIARTETSALHFAEWGLDEVAAMLQQEASQLRAELLAGFGGVTW